MRFVAVLLVLLSPVVAHAQTCLGGSDVNRRQPVHFISSIGFEDTATSVTGGALGGNDNFFGGGTAEIAWLEVPAGSASVTGYGFDAFAGAQVGTRSRRVMLCPMVTVFNGFINNFDGLNTNLWGLDIGASMNLGLVLADSATIKVIPTFGVGFSRSRLQAKNGTASVTDTETGAVFHVGVGFVLHERFTITPLVQGGFEGGSNFVLAFSVNFPRR